MLTESPLSRLTASPQDRTPDATSTAMQLAVRNFDQFHDWAQTAPTRAHLVVAATTGAVAAIIAPLAAPVAAAYGAFGLNMSLRARHRRHVRRMRDTVNHELELLVSDVKAGVAPTGALARLSSRFQTWGREHSDPSTVALADRLKALAAIVEHTGAPAATLLERVVADLHASTRAEAALMANTAGTRASVRMLAALPLLGPLLGAAIGADPVAVLFHTPIGVACLFGAVILQAVGLIWSSRIRRSVEGQVLMR